MFVKPKKGLKVSDPGNKYLPMPEEGLEVLDTHPYWVRRVACGDVEVIESGKKSTTKKDSDKETKGA